MEVSRQRARRIAYCTNVHAGRDWPQQRSELEKHVPAVREHWGQNGPLPLGLWFSAASAASLTQPEDLAGLSVWLERLSATCTTLNGFPYGNFHQAVVKHDDLSSDMGGARTVGLHAAPRLHP